MFCYRKKKKNTGKILAIIGIFVAAAAATVGAYFLFTKVLKGKLFAKKACEEIEECNDDEIVEELPEEACEETAETAEVEVVEAEDAVEVVEE